MNIYICVGFYNENPHTKYDAEKTIYLLLNAPLLAFYKVYTSNT